MPFIVPIFVLAGPLSAAEASKEDAIRKDLEKMQGTWCLVSLEEAGTKATAAQLKEFQVTIAGDRFTFTDGRETDKGFYKLDPARTLRAMDIVLDAGPNKGKTRLAIYEFDGDTFKVAVAEPGVARPAGFTPGRGYNVKVWKRSNR
jgi:uncharacterized protein (TIGR03067 family)